jgi:predicted nucleic acid-binding Zn ribbon protein
MTTGDLGIAQRLNRFKSGSSRTKTVGARLCDSEEDELIAAAQREGRNISEWAREVLLREARRSKDDALFTEIIATRMLLVNLLKPLLMGQKVTSERLTEIMTTVRTEKRKAAQEVMQQYTTSD